jgi:hypothetical protein
MSLYSLLKLKKKSNKILGSKYISASRILQEELFIQNRVGLLILRLRGAST